MNMPASAHRTEFEALLQHPALWRGRGIAAPNGYPSGHVALDAVLPGGGWPRHGLVEILVPDSGSGELTLWAPLVRELTRAPAARCCAFIAPPYEPFAPAWQAQGVRMDRLLVVRAAEPRQAAAPEWLSSTSTSSELWALEQSLLSGACAMGFAWLASVDMTSLRRLALATERGGSLGVLIRPLRAAREHTTAVLRISLRRSPTHLKLRVLKGRGLAPCSVELPLP